MRIAWLTLAEVQGTDDQPDSINASARYRMLLPAQQLARRGHRVDMVHPRTSRQLAAQAIAGADAVVLGKLLADQSGSYEAGARFYGELLRHAASQARLVFDLNDDHFDDPSFRDFYTSHRPHAYVAASSEMARVLQQVNGAHAAVIADPYEGPAGTPRPVVPSRYPRLFRILDRLAARGDERWRVALLWFGHPAGLRQLRVVLPELRELARHMPLRLHCVTSPCTEIEDLLSRQPAQSPNPLALSFEPWSKEATWRALHACDIVLLPGEVSSDKVKAKSANRLVEAIRAGRFTVAHPLPAYGELSEYAHLGRSLAKGIIWAAHHPHWMVERVIRGQNHIAARFSAEAIAERWLEVIRGPEALEPGI